MRNPTKPDQLYLQSGFFPAEPYDPETCDFRVSLSNVNGTIWEGALLPGDLVRRGNFNRYKNRDARHDPTVRDGIFLTQMSVQLGGYWRFKMKVFTQLDAATESEMTLAMQTCGNRYELTTTWRKLANGFKLNMRTIP